MQIVNFEAIDYFWYHFVREIIILLSNSMLTDDI